MHRLKSQQGMLKKIIPILLWFTATRVANFRDSMSLMLWVNLHVVNSPTKQQVCCGSEDQGNGWLDQTLKIKWTKFMHLFFSHFKATKCLKCIWHEKYFLLIWKAFENTEEWRLSFWNIFFCFRDIDIFLLCKLDQWWRRIVCN